MYRTIRVVDPMSEYEIGRQIGVSFAQQQVGLKFVATDGDAKAFMGYRMPCQQSRQNGRLTQHISVRHSSDIS